MKRRTSYVELLLLRKRHVGSSFMNDHVYEKISVALAS